VEHAEALARADVIGRFPEDAALVLVAQEPIKSAARSRGRRTKAAPEADLALSDAVENADGTIERYDRIMPGDVPRWINGRAKLAGVTLRPDALDALSSALAGDTERIENELAKLASWANGQPVTGDDVRALVSGAIESDVFELTKAVVRRDVRTAAPLLERLLAEGNVPQQLLALLLWQFRVLLFASRDPKPAEAEKMAKAIRSSPGAILRYTQYARGLAPSDIARAYESLYACDVSIKTGRADSDEAALLLCVMDLCGVQGADYRDFLLREAPKR
jgi:DNA polymerase-3 subunit delta